MHIYPSFILEQEPDYIMGFERRNVLEELIEKVGGCAVIDGGFATQLENHGASINDPLWSALCLIKDPQLIQKVHSEYLQAGADVIVTSSYQATIPGFLSRGLSMGEAEGLLRKSVNLAVVARDKFWEAIKENIPQHSYNYALVAASIGSYGAYLADGSEYRAKEEEEIDVAKFVAASKKNDYYGILAGASEEEDAELRSREEEEDAELRASEDQQQQQHQHQQLHQQQQLPRRSPRFQTPRRSERLKLAAKKI